MSKYQFTDPLASDRTLTTSRIDISEVEPEINPNEGSLSLYDAFSFSRNSSAKIASQRSNMRLRNLKGNLTIKNTSIFEMMKMLALCENRYKTETQKLTKAISKTIFINNVGIVGLIIKLKPIVNSAIKALKKTFLFR